MSAIITLTTDFGDADGYVGAMKGVILSLAPHATVIDISHAVPAQQVRHAARVLATAAPFFPPGTIHVAVVDPGVGSQRRGIALQTPTAMFVGPDNGLFSPFLRAGIACVALTNPAAHHHPVSATFHGRDIFAPVAAHLSNDMPLAALGPAVDDPVMWSEPQPQRLPGGRLRAQVIYVDRFGNLVTNVGPLSGGGDVRVRIGGTALLVRRTYANVEPGELVALIGSSGYLEIAVRDGSAAERLGMDVGAPVEIQGGEDALDDLDTGTPVADH
jgi:S-adenosyl-L-methionine hydrolase (adenosine-forming)